MSSTSQRQSVLDAILALTDQIARTSPESAEAALRIAELAQDLGAEPDGTLVRDTIEAETADTDLSDARIQTTADAVLRASRQDS